MKLSSVNPALTSRVFSQKNPHQSSTQQGPRDQIDLTPSGPPDPPSNITKPYWREKVHRVFSSLMALTATCYAASFAASYLSGLPSNPLYWNPSCFQSRRQ